MRHNQFRNLLMTLGYDSNLHYQTGAFSAMKRDAERRMDNVDALSKPLRDLVKEFGYHAVHAFLQYQITDPKAIRYMICAARGIMPESGHLVLENRRPYRLKRLTEK